MPANPNPTPVTPPASACATLRATWNVENTAPGVAVPRVRRPWSTHSAARAYISALIGAAPSPCTAKQASTHGTLVGASATPSMPNPLTTAKAT